MIFLSLLFVAVSITLICYLLLVGFNQAAKRYERDFKKQMQVELSAAFLFFDPVQLWSFSLALTVLVFFSTWVLLKFWCKKK